MSRSYNPVLPSAARTSAPASVELEVPARVVSALFLVDVTSYPAAASITPIIRGVVPATGTEYVILTGSPITAVGVAAIELGPGMDDTANEVETVLFPNKIVFDMTHADTDSITYSVDVVWI